MVYLVQKYGRDDSLYSSQSEKRATINRLLFYSEILQQCFIDYIVSIIAIQQRKINSDT